jgi:phosphate-selective porin OprO and OprP
MQAFTREGVDHSSSGLNRLKRIERNMSGLSRIGTVCTAYCCLSVFLCVLIVTLSEADPLYPLSIKGAPDGLHLRSNSQAGVGVRLGAVLDVDYRHYLEDERADNRFDVRRARLVLDGRPAQWLRIYAQYEFQGGATNNLLDAYVDLLYRKHALRLGQFKQPFGLEWQTRDKAILFAERAMLQYLSPARGVGAMLHGSVGLDQLHYGIGLFNADGDDSAARGTQEDAPEVVGRLVVAPFKRLSAPWIRNLQVGGAFSYADIELANLNLRVKSTGMAGTSYNLYTLGQNTKFGVLQDVQSRRRLGLEAAWAWGPLLIQGEYVAFRYTGLKPAGQPSADADFSAWQAGCAIVLTGEPWVFGNAATPLPVNPRQPFRTGGTGWGALVLAARAEQFKGDEDWIAPNAFVSVHRADAFSLSLIWVPLPMARVLCDYTRTDLSDPIRTRVNPDGSVDYITVENVLTLRFSIDF